MANVLTSELVSIVLPVYNGESFLLSTFQSITDQLYKNIEIIVVNDGSTDDTSKILLALKQDNLNYNIKIIEQKNSGLPAARNTGIREAQGEFIFFIDADDYLPSGAIEELVYISRRDSTDVVAGNFVAFRENKSNGGRVYRRYAGLTEENIFFSELSGSLSDVPKIVYLSSAWGKLYRMRFLLDNLLYFDENCFYAEDVEFNSRVYACADIVSISPFDCYHYRIDSGVSMMDQGMPLDRFELLFSIGVKAIKRYSGWPRYYYAQRFLDYELFQNIRHIRVMTYKDAEVVILLMREYLHLVGTKQTIEFINKKPQYKKMYKNLLTKKPYWFWFMLKLRYV